MDGISTRKGMRKVLSEKKILQFRVPNLETRLNSEEFGRPIKTICPVEAHAVRWRLCIFRCIHAIEDLDDDEDYDACIWVEQVVGASIIQRYSGKYRVVTENREESLFSHERKLSGGSYTLKLSAILDPQNGYLNHVGSLILDVAIRVYEDAFPIWYPPIEKPPSWFPKMVHSAKFSDALVVVSETEFHLHRFLLDIRAPALCELCANPDDAVKLDDVNLDSFRSLVEFIYSNEPPTLDSIEEAMEVLSLADRFGCQDLKLFAESTITEKYLKPSNAAELVLIGHSHSCALLKESAITVCSKRAKTVVGTKGWKLLTESPELMTELYLASNTEPLLTHGQDPDRMPVADLRDQLLKRKLDVDGSRETLIKRLRRDFTVNTTDA